MKPDLSQVLILSGPTAAGKTDFSYELAKHFPIEIINADMGQFYVPCSVGTAKPGWRSEIVPHHLFDIIDTPTDMSVTDYRERVIRLVKEIRNRGHIPLIVGGSYFYISSLFYPPLSYKKQSDSGKDSYEQRTTAELWTSLSGIDPIRADKIHINDRYRIIRALDIWEQTKILPSKQVPIFNPPFNACFITLAPQRDSLNERINKRTEMMLGDPDNSPWATESRTLYGTQWEAFLRKKGLIGYTELFDWFSQGSQKADFEALIKAIQQTTRTYAKRQMTFWRRLRKLLEHEFTPIGAIMVIEMDRIDEENKALMVRSIHEFLDEKVSSQ